MKFLPALIAASLLAACGARSSDEQQVREVLAAMEVAAESRDASDVLEHVADDYEDAQGYDKAQLTNFLRGYFLANPKIELLLDIENLEFPAEGLARAEVAVTGVALGELDHESFKVELRRQGDEWLLTRADRLRP